MTPADDPGQLLAVGDLARATGLTVRTLHHYDRLGLLSLAEIARLLAGEGPDPLRLLRRQLTQTEERIAAAQRLRHSLLAVISGLTSHDGEVMAFQLVELIERMITVDRKLTREQLDQLIEQRRQLTARLTPTELAQLQKQREEQVSKLTPAQLAELQQRRQQLLPADFPAPGAG
jgi:hypothetical protein